MSDDDIPDLVPLDAQRTKAEQPASSPAPAPGPARRFDHPVPVTLITGFLGAGKTTLVNHILTEQHGFRVAVILNEFGEERGIEKALLQDERGGRTKVDEWVELTNGCLCCSVKDDFVNALESLMLQQSPFDYILIETTGLANPGPIASALWTDEELEAGVVLDSIVTVVDALNIRTQLGRAVAGGNGGAANEAQQQVAYADVVLLNKTDLVAEGELQEVEAALRRHNSTVRVVPCQRCSIDVSCILNQAAYQGTGLDVPDARSSPPCGHTDCPDTRCGHSQNHTARSGDGVATHDPAVTTVSLRVSEAVELEGVRSWLDGVLWESADVADIYRIKGVIAARDDPTRHVIQAVHDLYDITAGPAWAQGEERMTRIVVIGRYLSHPSLLASLRAACVQ